jgi:hypothetical protein
MVRLSVISELSLQFSQLVKIFEFILSISCQRIHYSLPMQATFFVPIHKQPPDSFPSSKTSLQVVCE